jgi:hypothetical protein
MKPLEFLSAWQSIEKQFPSVDFVTDATSWASLLLILVRIVQLLLQILGAKPQSRKVSQRSDKKQGRERR